MCYLDLLKSITVYNSAYNIRIFLKTNYHMQIGGIVLPGWGVKQRRDKNDYTLLLQPRTERGFNSAKNVDCKIIRG